MKRLAFSILALFFLHSLALAQNGKIDSKLVGSWKGHEIDQQMDGLEKYWIQNRFEDGRSQLLFTMIYDCEVEIAMETGTWWVEDGIFYEKNTKSGRTDSYEYVFLDDDNVKFKSIKMGVEVEVDSYEFVDTRLTEEN